MPHGQSARTGKPPSPSYQSWTAMIQRCRNPNAAGYRNYGGRGITVCEAWRHDFSAFLHDMGRKPSQRHSIERSNNDKDYDPQNCKWALPTEQMRNRRNSFFVDVNDERVPLEQLAQKYNIPSNTLRARIVKGWPLVEALTKPVRFKTPG